MILHGSNSSIHSNDCERIFFFNWSFAGICAKTLVVNQWSRSCIVYIFRTNFVTKAKMSPIKWYFERRKRCLLNNRQTHFGKNLKRCTLNMSDIIYKSITLIPHSRCLLLRDFLQHTVPESSFNISLSTATACGPILKQFITCVNYYPGAGWVWAGGWGVTVQSVYALVCVEQHLSLIPPSPSIRLWLSLRRHLLH